MKSIYTFDIELFIQDCLKLRFTELYIYHQLIHWVDQINGKEVYFNTPKDLVGYCNKFQIHKDWCREVR